MAKGSRASRGRRSRPEAFLTVLRRFIPPDAWGKVEAVFVLGRELRKAQRDNDEPVTDVGILLDLIDDVGPLWRDAAYVLAERGSPPEARP